VIFSFALQIVKGLSRQGGSKRNLNASVTVDHRDWFATSLEEQKALENQLD